MTQSQLLQFAVETLERLGIDYALVGSLASSTLGEPRFTNDIDILVELDVFDAACLCDAFGDDQYCLYKPAIIDDVTAGRMFNILHPASSNKIDFMLVGDSEWSRNQLKRRMRRDVLDVGQCFIAAPEDVILGKLLYYQDGGSEKLVRDITGILVRSSDLVDREYLDRTADELGVGEEWRSILAKLG